MELVYGIMAAIALSVILGFFQNRKKKQAWVGTVTKIKYLPSFYDMEENLQEARYLIHYRTDAGKKGKINIRENQYGQLFPGLREGSRLQKQAGQNFPNILQ